MKLALLAIALLAGSLHAQDLPLKPEPAHLGQWIRPGEMMGDFSDDLIITDRKEDGRRLWHVERVGSCAWCGRPMDWKQAAFDGPAFAHWAVSAALAVTDIELSHRAPCFQSGRCREGNPLLGQSRAQAYAVTGALTGLEWLASAWFRKGDKANHVGGAKYWWLLPMIRDGWSIVGITNSLARWRQ